MDGFPEIEQEMSFAHVCQTQCGNIQTAETSIRAFCKLGTEPLPLGLEKLIRKSHLLEQPMIELPWRHESSLIGC